ncbi:MAG: esterase [Prevotella sp.]|nr:esterase [Prevotella sp.]
METNSYIKQYPDLMAGKKIMYVHGFASSAQSGTVKRLRTMFPQTTIIAEDIPVHPAEGFAMLSELAQREQPDLIIGTSMGGMYTEMLYGFDRILINPAFRIADTMGAHGMTGKQVFQNPRKDGVQEFLVTKSMVKEYRDMQEKCFSQAEDPKRVWGLFGDQDPLVHTMPVFMEHYTQGIWFHGEHRTNDHVFMNSVVPVIRWIDDKQECRVRPVVFITIDALRNPQRQQRPSAMKAFRMLLESYNVYIVAPSPNYDADYVKDVQQWTDDIVNVPAYGHLIFTNQLELLMGDYLIGTDDVEGFMGATIRLGSETFKTWDDIIVYFSRLGGQ